MRLRPFRDYLDEGLAMIGSPHDVRERLQEYLDATGYQRAPLLMALPGLATGEALRSMRRSPRRMPRAEDPAAVQ